MTEFGRIGIMDTASVAGTGSDATDLLVSYGSHAV